MDTSGLLGLFAFVAMLSFELQVHFPPSHSFSRSIAVTTNIISVMEKDAF